MKNGTLQNACSIRPRVVVGFEEKCSLAHRQVDEQPQEREPVSDECHDRPRKPGRGVIGNWDKFHLNVNLLMHGNWVAYFKT